MTRSVRPIVYIVLILIAFFSAFYQGTLASKITKNSSESVTHLIIQGAIGPATADYIEKGIKASVALHAKAIVLSIDTPGGLSTAMRSIIKAILSAKIPVIGYVSPSGARAASAGTYILYATHIAAMAPGTNLGSATPVNIISPATPGEKDKNDAKPGEKKTKKKPQSASQAKMINDAKAYIQSLAELRNRNVEWAVKAVESAESISAKEALKLNVINLISPSIKDLLNSVNGEMVVVNNVKEKLVLNNPSLKNIKQDWKNKILQVITNPSVAYILLMLGVYGLFFEFINPGFIVPGVTGAISLLLALYAFQMLPINYVGLGLILLGMIFMIAEVFMPSFGALGLGGIVSFLIGSFMLLETKSALFALPWQLIIGVTVTTVLFMIGVIQLLVRSRHRKVVSGTEGMIGANGVIEKDGDSYWVIVAGERWHVKSEKPISDQQTVKIVRVDGLTLIVE